MAVTNELLETDCGIWYGYHKYTYICCM